MAVVPTFSSAMAWNNVAMMVQEQTDILDNLEDHVREAMHFNTPEHLDLSELREC